VSTRVSLEKSDLKRESNRVEEADQTECSIEGRKEGRFIQREWSSLPHVPYRSEEVLSEHIARSADGTKPPSSILLMGILLTPAKYPPRRQRQKVPPPSRSNESPLLLRKSGQGGAKTELLRVAASSVVLRLQRR